MTTAINNRILEQNLIIESITLLDGVTPDEEVQYKLGREVWQVQGVGIGAPVMVFYNERRVWSTYPLIDVKMDEEKVVLTDRKSIYTFKRKA